MVAAEPSERLHEAERIEPTQLDAGLSQARPEMTRSLAACTQPVLKDPHPDAAPCSVAHRLGESVSDRVLSEDVALERNAVIGAFDCLEPRRVVFRRVAEQPQPVAGDQRGTSGARERVLRHRPQGGERRIGWVDSNRQATLLAPVFRGN